LGYLLAFLGRLGTAFSVGASSVLSFRSLDRLGKLRDAPRDAYLAEVSPKNHRGLSFGILRSFDNLGAVFGIIIAIALFPVLGFRNLIMLAALPTLLSVLLIVFFIREQVDGVSAFGGIHARDFSRNLKLLLVSIGVFALGNFSYSFVLIGAQEFGFSVQSIMLLYLVFSVAASLSAAPFGELADVLGRKKTLFLSYLFWLILLAGFLFKPSGALVWFLFISYGLFKGSFETVTRVFVADLANPRLKASTLGFLQLIIGLLALPASFLAGMLWEFSSPTSPFAFSLILTLISLILLLRVRER